MAPVNVSELKTEEFKKFLDSFDHVISDCDGVFYSSAKGPFPRAGEFYALMKKLGKTVHFISNNSLNSKEKYDEIFKKAGVDDGYDNLTIPSKVTAEYLKEVNLKKKAYCVTCTEPVKVLESYGIHCETGPHDTTEDFGEFFKCLKDDEEIGAVVFDGDLRINLLKLYRAGTYLARPDVHFINGSSEKIWTFSPGMSVLGTSGFTDLVADLVNRTPVTLGKPGKKFGEVAMKRAGVTDASRVLFIGDLIEQDVGLGKVVGSKTLLLLTTATKEEMLTHPTIKPDFYAPELASIVPLLSDAAKK